jgi:osmotically-inducible protein OsmY
VKALGLLVLAALAAAACTREIQPEDDSDPAIKARLELALRARKGLDLRYVSIDVNERLVTLSGIVPALEQLRAVERIAKTTPGVEQVMDNLVVQE